MEPDATAALRALLPHLPRKEAQRLVEFAGPVLGLIREADYLPSLPPPVRFEVDLCCILENRFFLLIGWLFDPTKEVSSAQVSLGRSVLSFLKKAVPIVRSDVNVEAAYFRKAGTTPTKGFVCMEAISAEDADVNEARFHFTAGSETVQVTRTVINVAQEARRDFLSFVGKTDPDFALILIEQVATFLQKFPEQRALSALLELVHAGAIERLPVSLQHTNPRYSLCLDRAIPIADEGLFLMGWLYVESARSVRVVCHRGGASFVVSDNWSSHTRPDVKSDLESKGIHSEAEHGFACYVPLKTGDEPCYLSATLDSGETRRMRVLVDAKRESALEAVCTVLSTFSPSHPHLGFLLDHHVGLAVTAAWAARGQLHRKLTVKNYGTPPASPALSIIVPLYGRYDFAEYQIVMFADDPEFRSVELIYVVDDPVIAPEFAYACPDLYGMYQVPFVFAFGGANLGFAGANNLGVEVARAQHLLFMNSDVMPKRRGWTGELLRIYKSLRAPGLLGAKLLYEDGCVQHAGIAFRRYPRWNDLWINDHPLKGQSPLGLTGVREAEAVTAACAVIDAQLYRKLGGFCQDYIVGDFEDSDLCLRASAAGRCNYVALDVELYHLERQSQNRMGDRNLRSNLTLYNCWLHNRRWAKMIAARESVQAAHSGSAST